MAFHTGPFLRPKDRACTRIGGVAAVHSRQAWYRPPRREHAGIGARRQLLSRLIQTTLSRTLRGPGEVENEGTRTQTSRNSGSTRPIQPQDHEWLAEGTAEEDTRSQRDRREQRRRRRRNRTERHATRRRCRMQRNEWTRAHRSPHTEATEGADPTSSPRDSRRRHPNEASARGSPPGPWATSRRRPSTASSRARRPAAQSTRAAGCSSPSAHWTRRGELHYRPPRETTPAHLRRQPHKLGVIDLRSSR